MILSRNMLKMLGESRHPCWTPTVVLNQSPMLLLTRTALVALLQRFLMTWIRFVLMLYFFLLPTKLHAKLCRRPSWSLWRHGRGLAGAWNISHIECVGWRSALWYSFLLWSLPVLRRWSSPLVASICSLWSSVWLCLDDWWGSLFGSSGTAAGCFSWEVWWLGTGSMGLDTFLSAKFCCRLLWERDYILSTCLDQFCWDVVGSSWLPFLQLLYCSLHFSWKHGLVILYVCLQTVQYWWISIGLVQL